MTEKENGRQRFLRRIGQSAKSFRNRRILCVCGVLIALCCVLYAFSIEIPLFGTTQKISFAYLAAALIAMIGGPCIAVPAALIIDTLSFLLHPTGPYVPWFCLVWVLQMLLWSAFLYRRPLGGGRLFLAKLSHTLLCNVLLNSILVYYTYSARSVGLLVYLAARLPKNLILLPVEWLLLCLLLQGLLPFLARLSLCPPAMAQRLPLAHRRAKPSNGGKNGNAHAGSCENKHKETF